MVKTKETYSKWKDANPVLRQLNRRRRNLYQNLKKNTTAKMVALDAQATQEAKKPKTNDSENNVSEDNENPTIKSALQINVPVRNQFRLLESQEEMEIQDMPDEEISIARTQKTKVSKKPKPPAIVLHYRIESHLSLTKTMDIHVKKGYYIKNSKNHTNIYINDYDEYQKFKEILEKEDTIFPFIHPQRYETAFFCAEGNRQ